MEQRKAGGTRLIATGVRRIERGQKLLRTQETVVSCVDEESGLEGRASAFTLTTSTGRPVIEALCCAPPTMTSLRCLLDTLRTTSITPASNAKLMRWYGRG